MLATPTQCGPKFPESGDLAPVLLPGPAGRCSRTVHAPARGVSGRPRSLLVFCGSWVRSSCVDLSRALT